MEDYGVLTGLVDDIGALVAAGCAVMLSFKGRQKWEPSEEDVPKGPVKVVGTLTAVGVALLYWLSKTNFDGPLYFGLAATLSGVLVIGFLIYVMLITIYTFDREIAVNGEVLQDKVVGGFLLTPEAKEQLQEARTVQLLFKGAGYDPDLVWNRGARALAKVAFLATYFVVIVCGCLSLTAAAILLNELPS